MKVILIAFLITLFSTTGALSQKPTAWRGGTNGNYPDKGLLKTWPQNGPDILWVAEGIGEGFSSPVFANGKIFVSTMIDTTGFIVILDLKGKELKRYSYGTEFFESYPGARSTPVIVGDWLYIYSGRGTIYAFDAEKGTLRWKRDLIKEKNYKTLAPKVCLRLEDGWEDREITKLGYPVMGLYDGEWRYSAKALASAQAYAEQNGESEVLNKIKTIKKELAAKEAPAEESAG